MKQALWQSLAILALAVVLGAVSYLARPELLPANASAYEIDLVAARSLDGALWIDARTDADFEAAHLQGAMLLNEENWDAGFVPLLERWLPGMPIVVYCSSQSCLRSHHVAERLREELGADEIYALRGGWEALLEAGVAKVEGER
ncbi:rhodanese-like domain-containing protein [Pelagicoccus sp. NFK12]|uniref:Rhodanese-like domain-containing protein n=1 Tax=Pelagicoccus enzymogenes TaxID=2773457 RepID=A0A927F9E0_9BACT|nr:rhodanese-like domain-containing protein [Pelagicoccus enzymogenes]MBD5780146.1 rhodanese-like domain-containing protein [Pelagicoccus enzymogenes]MDQ8199133.1 rhodanese-like domain-containing protein [Pelagicoccus enzymogenes]